MGGFPVRRSATTGSLTGAFTICLLLFCDAGCRNRPPTTEASSETSRGGAAADSTTRPGNVADAGPVQIEMRNVRLHLDEGVVLEVATLRGEMITVVRDQPPVFDDPRSYVLQLFDADVSMDMASVTNLMNRHVFHGEHSPLTDIEMEIDDGRLKQKAKLHKGIVLPISTLATVSATDDGRMRLRTEKVSTLGIPTKGLLDLLNLELADLVKLKEQRGVEIRDNDVIISPGRILPPPELRGRLTTVSIAGNRLHQVFGGGAHPSRLSPPDAATPNYIYFSGSQLRFGKLTMTGADLQLIDADSRDPFDFSPAQYSRQLVAGYSKNTPQGGLKTYMPDLNDLHRVRDLRPR